MKLKSSKVLGRDGRVLMLHRLVIYLTTTTYPHQRKQLSPAHNVTTPESL